MKTFQNFVRVLSITSVIFLAKAGVVFITMQGSALAYGGPHHYEDSRSLTKSYGSKSRSFRNSGSLRSSRRLGGGCLSVDCPEIVVRAHRLARMDSFGSRLLRESWRVQAMERELCGRVGQREQSRCEAQARLIAAATFGACGGVGLVTVGVITSGFGFIIPGALPLVLGACAVASNAVSEYGIAECESEAALTKISRGCGTRNISNGV